jgi:hypothetical protein
MGESEKTTSKIVFFDLKDLQQTTEEAIYRLNTGSGIDSQLEYPEQKKNMARNVYLIGWEM